jgi:hypothetical protein
VEKKVEPPSQPGFHSHGHTAHIHHAKPEKKGKPGADDMLAASLQNLPKGGVHHHDPHAKKRAGTA